MDKSGLANQTRSLVEMLNPSKVLVINSAPFTNKGAQNPTPYLKYNSYESIGMLGQGEGIRWMQGLDAVLSCEMFYSETFIDDARARGVKTLLQYNYEFLVNLLLGSHSLPDVLISPSYWRLDEAKNKFGDRVIYLPPPTNESKFATVRGINMARNGKRFLHVVGHKAAHDRNGTDDLVDAMQYVKDDFELVIKSQTKLDLNITDPRITIDYSSPLDETQLYQGFDALILPRRYAGLCLPMNEALMSGLPVIMIDIEPNNKILPPEWLCQAHKKSQFMAKTIVDVYESDLVSLADRISWLCKTDLTAQKEKAYNIGYDNFSFEVLRPKYAELLNDLS